MTKFAPERPTCLMRLSRVLRCTVFIAFFGTVSFTGFIVLDFLPAFEKGQLVIVRKSHLPKISNKSSEIMSSRKRTPDLLTDGENFREHVKRLEKSSARIGADNVRHKKKYFIYRCDTGKLSDCDDWADHVNGIQSAYVMANLTGRVFKAELRGFPCLLSDFVSPHVINWSLPHSFHTVLNKGMAGVGIRNFDNNRHFYNGLYKIDLKEIAQENYEHIYFKSNLDFMAAFQNSTVYSRQLAWMRGLGRDEIHAALYRRLFLLSTRLQKKLDLFMYSILPSREHRLICLDIGTRRNRSINSVDKNDYPMQHLPKIWSFIKVHSKTNIDKLFIHTDSVEILSSAKNEIFRDRLVSPPRKLTQASKSKQFDLVCEKLELEIFVHHMLVNCDVLVVSTNNLGRLAAYLRATDLGLFCLTNNGHIHPCRTDSLNEMYRIHE